MGMTYQQALREYAKQHGRFVLPRKGTAEYDAVKTLMAKKPGVAEEQARAGIASSMAKQPSATSEGSLIIKDSNVLQTAVGQQRQRLDEPPALKTKLIDDPADELKGKKVVKNAEKAPKKVKGNGVNRTGKSTEINNTEMLVNSNTGMSAEVSAEYPKQKEKIKKDLKKKVETTAEVEPIKDATIQNMKSDEPETLSGGSIPFSIEALRKQLRC